MKKLLPVLLLLVGASIFPTKSEAQFAVFDGTNYAMLGKIWQSDVSTGVKIVKETQQLVKIYQTDMAVYQLGMFMAQALAHPRRAAMLVQGPMMVSSVISSRYGENVDFPAAMNGNNALSARAWSGNQVVASDPYMALEKMGQSYAIAKLGRKEQADAANLQCTQVLSDYYNKRKINQNPIDLLKAAGLDISKPVNSLIAQLNLENSHNQQLHNEAMNQGNIQACLAQQQMIANADRADETTKTLNTYADMNAAAHDNGSYMGPIYGAQGFNVF